MCSAEVSICYVSPPLANSSIVFVALITRNRRSSTLPTRRRRFRCQRA